MLKKTKYVIEVYPDTGKSWRWRKLARRGRRRVVSASGESFHHKGNAIRAAQAEADAMRETPEIRNALS
jgi:hypothetical protein